MDRKYTVVIADDQEIVRDGIIGVINSFDNFKVVMDAPNGKDLYEKMLEMEVLPDIVVLDINMPVWDGYKTIEVLKKKWPGLFVLILTMHTHEKAILKMLAARASGYVFKNTRRKNLEDALNTIVEGRIYLNNKASDAVYHSQDPKSKEPLTEKEIQILKLCHTELTYFQMGEELKISERAIKNSIDTLFGKFGVNSRFELIYCAGEMGFISFD